MPLSITQARFDKINVLLGRGDALFRFLLESVEHVHHPGKAHGINGPVGVAVEIIGQLQDSTPAESLQRLRGYRLLTFLHLMQGVPHAVLHLGRESLQVLTAGANKDAGFGFGPFYSHFLYYGDIPINVKRVAIGGQTVLTSGISSLDTNTNTVLLRLVQTFNAFTHDNDAHGEHDFGAIV